MPYPLSPEILELPEAIANFTKVDRPTGQCLLHNETPIWINEFPAIPGVRPKHWQVYYSPACPRTDRDPWKYQNFRLSDDHFVYLDPAAAVADAIANAKGWPKSRCDRG